MTEPDPGQTKTAPLNLTSVPDSDLNSDLNTSNSKVNPKNSTSSSNSISQNSVSKLSTSANLSDVAFFIKYENDYIPLSTKGFVYKDLRIYMPYFDFLEVSPRNFSLVGTRLTLNEGKMAGSPVGFHEDILSFGNHTKPADFQIDKNGSVRGYFQACHSNYEDNFVIHKPNKPSTYCPQVELYLLPSYKPRFTDEYNGSNVHYFDLDFWNTRFKNNVLVNYVHGKCQKAFRDDYTKRTLVEIKRDYDFAYCMIPTQPSCEKKNFYFMGPKELQEYKCFLKLTGNYSVEYSKTFLKGFDEECNITINEKKIFRQPGKTWIESISLNSSYSS